ncbi:GGDEF domain-containing protein [Pseudoalteromonas sp.]|uniref:GGDEF domain-containing protein n=1 Tax=Pseudoalteromonas sp. TaxID=53249 RepID=UPI003D146F0B
MPLEQNSTNYSVLNYLQLPVIVFSANAHTEVFKIESFQLVEQYYLHASNNPTNKHLAQIIYSKLSENDTDKLEVEINNGSYRHILRLTANVVGEHVIVEGEDITELKRNQFLFNRTNTLLEDYSKQMFELAHTDKLTNVPNRRALFSKFSQLQSKHKEFSCTVSLIDLDYFKRFNDSFGHDFGDQVLVTFSKHVKDSIDDTCYFARLGGEEFCLIQINNKDTVCFAITEKLLQTTKTIKLMTPDNSYIGMSFSAGVAVYGNDGISLDELLNNADKALYFAKENGRSRVVKFEGA